MTTINWGNLTKSQDDNETIEQAIDRLISAHEASSDAHLGVGESLETHKSFEIIDHPAGSVLADKITRNEILWFSNFGENALWNKNNVHDYEWPLMSLPEAPDTADQAYMYFESTSFLLYVIHDSKDVIFQVSMSIESDDTTSYGHVGFGVRQSLVGVGFGFKIMKNGCQAYVKSYTTTSTANISNLVDGERHVLRAEYNHVDNNVYFYSDGVLLATIEIPSGSFQYQSFFGFCTHVSSNDTYFFMSPLSMMISKNFT